MPFIPWKKDAVHRPSSRRVDYELIHVATISVEDGMKLIWRAANQYQEGLTRKECLYLEAQYDALVEAVTVLRRIEQRLAIPRPVKAKT